MDWTNDLALQLIEEYRKRPELWDQKHDVFRVLSSRYEAWQELAGLFSCDVIDLRKKLNSLFASHRRERQKVRHGVKSTWFAYSHLKFLPSHLDDSQFIEEKIENVEVQPDTDSDHYLNEEHLSELAEEVTVKDEENVFQNQDSPSNRQDRKRVTNNTETPRLIRRTKKKALKLSRTNTNVSNNDDRVLNNSTAKSDVDKTRDECDAFGEYIANCLKKHDERTRSMIKHAINNIMFEQEMKKYSSTQYQMITIDEENPLGLTERLEDSDVLA